jgi:hypothetical protein
MLFRKHESDIEMSGMMDGAPKKKKPQGPPEETEYQKFDWKRFFLAPKYIRKSARRPCDRATFLADSAYSMAYIVHRHRYLDSHHHD